MPAESCSSSSFDSRPMWRNRRPIQASVSPTYTQTIASSEREQCRRLISRQLDERAPRHEHHLAATHRQTNLISSLDGGSEPSASVWPANDHRPDVALSNGRTKNNRSDIEEMIDSSQVFIRSN